MSLLSVRGLGVRFGALPAVEDVSFAVGPGEVLALVGESGSGKTVTSLAVAGLLEGTAEVTGSVRLEGREIAGLPERALRRVRGREVAMVFQDASAALNPCETVGDQIAEAIVAHGLATPRAARARAVERLAEVGLPEPGRRARLYPHALSGGQRQRVLIAMALACDPKALIADEPTTALDVTTQAQILALLKGAVERRGMGCLFVTHDLGVVAALADRVMVMYAGRIVEETGVEGLFARPRHPYAADLIEAAGARRDARGRLPAIPGAPPRLDARGEGCAYAPRCRRAEGICARLRPALAGGAACHFAEAA